MKRKTLWGLALVVVAGSAGTWYWKSSTAESDKPAPRPFVTVASGSVIEKALATGTIQPENEVQVKSKISGVVRRIFAEPGTYVRAGDPLIEVSPDPTPQELADAKRNVELAQLNVTTLGSQLDRQRSLRERGMVSDREFEETERQFNDATVRLQIAQERLSLIESGSVTIDGVEIESIIKAPISGYILEKMVNIGDPVVPLTSYQAGTALMSMASMENLLFKGNVDEIDVGKIREGMPVEIKVGALPGEFVVGRVRRISLKATKVENATVFPVEIVITDTRGQTLRAGYSANADVIIHKVENVLVIPERLVVFRENEAYVEVLTDTLTGTGTEKRVELGASDAISVEVKAGLAEGERVLERPVKTLGAESR